MTPKIIIKAFNILHKRPRIQIFSLFLLNFEFYNMLTQNTFDSNIP